MILLYCKSYIGHFYCTHSHTFSPHATTSSCMLSAVSILKIFFLESIFLHIQTHESLTVRCSFQHIEKTVLWFYSSFNFHPAFHLIELNFNKLPSIFLHYLCVHVSVCIYMHVPSVKRKIFKAIRPMSDTPFWYA